MRSEITAAVYQDSELETILETNWILHVEEIYDRKDLNESYDDTDLERIQETEWVHQGNIDGTTAERQETLLEDSGAACHVCPRSWLPAEATERLEERQLRTANGKGMRYDGKLRVMISILGVIGRGEITFDATDVSKPILSVKKLLDHGHAVSFGKKNASFTHISG